MENPFQAKDNIKKKFLLTKNFFIDEIKSNLLEMTHINSGAKIIHIKNDDQENLFCLSFKTLPSTSNGIAHILEHTVLCGSEKFPVKDPFFSMIRRSLNTFMNAFTGSDYTCYPASSEIEKDFYNLLLVYSDCVFHPCLKKLSFLQEGHRLEYLIPDDPKTPLQFKGIVYNEMKGALNSADERLWNAMMEKLTPDLTYKYNSGGDPKEITDLKYEDLLEFHKKFYHPSHCLFFFYGNIDTEKHLQFLETNVFQNVKKALPLPEYNLQKRFSTPIDHVSYYPTAEEEKDSDVIAFGFLTTKITNRKDVLALTLIDSILTETDASPLTFALLSASLCNEVDTFFDTEMSEIPWVVICRGTNKKNKEKLFEIIIQTLKKIVQDKIPKSLIEAAMHQLEFSRTEINESSTPYGLTLFMRAALTTQQGCEVEDELKINSLFDILRKDLENPTYLTDLIQKYIINNQHLVKLSLQPDKKLEKKENILEQTKLELIEKNLKEEEKKQIIEQAKKLKIYQENVEIQSLECLPKIGIDEIPQRLKYYPLTDEIIDDFKVFFHNCFTNNIIYADLIFNLPEIEEKYLPYLSLFTTFITEIGCSDRDYKENLQYIDLYLGGFSCYFSTNSQANNPDLCSPSISLRGKALYRNGEKIFQLFKEVTTSAHFSDKKRIKELLKQHYTSLYQTLNQSAMSYAINDSLAPLSLPNYINNKLYGLPYFLEIKKIVEEIDSHLPKVIEKLQYLQNKILLSPADLVICCDQCFYEKIKQNHFFSLTKIKPSTSPLWKNDYNFEQNLKNEGKIIASSVAFTSEAYKTIGFKHNESPYLYLATSIMENKILHPKIREIGGAYGSCANYSTSGGCFYLYSYRDPHLSETLDIFKIAIEKISKGDFSSSDIVAAKLQAIQNIDSPIPLGRRALSTYFFEKTKRTKEERENFRKNILRAEKADIVKAVQNHLYNKIGNSKIVSYSGKEFFDKENSKLKKPLAIQSI